MRKLALILITLLLPAQLWAIQLGGVGPAGPTGPQGATGATGPQGATGTSGPAGPNTISGTTSVTVGSTGQALVNNNGVVGATPLGTAAAKDIPATGNATTTQVVYGTDTRLTDPRAPLAHAASHATGGADALTPAQIGAATAAQGTKIDNTAINLVTDFGAVADGTLTHLQGTDNTSAITAALSSAISTGKPLFIPAGIYRIGTLSATLPTGKRLKIYGEGTLYIDDDSNGVVGIQISGQSKTSSEKVEISGIKIVRYNTGVRHIGNITLMVFRVGNSTIENIEITGSSLISLMTNTCKRSVVRGCKVHDSVVAPTTDGISMTDTDEMIITDNNVWNVGDDGIAVANNATSGGIFNSVIANNTIRRDSGWCSAAVCGGHGIDVVGGMSNVIVANNTLSIADNYDGIGLWGGNIGGMNNITVVNNNITSLGSASWVHGISVKNDSTTYAVNGVKIAGNTITGMPDGVIIGVGATDYTKVIKNVEVDDNTINGTTYQGVIARYVDTLHVRKNTINAAGTNGIDAAYVQNWLDISGNSVTGYSTVSAGAVGLSVSNLSSAKLWDQNNKIYTSAAGAGAAKSITGTPIAVDTAAKVCTGTDKLSGYDPATGQFTCSADQAAEAATVDDTAYGSSWNGVTSAAPSKNAVYDKIEALVAGSGMVYPGAGVPNSTGSAWGTSYTVGTGASNLVQMTTAPAKLPAVDGSNLTNVNAATVGGYSLAQGNVANSVAQRTATGSLAASSFSSTFGTGSFISITDSSNLQALISKSSPSGNNATMDFNSSPADGTSQAWYRFGRNTNTTGAHYLQVLKGNNTSTANAQIGGNTDTYFAADNGKVGIGTATPGTGTKLDVVGETRSTTFTGTIPAATTYAATTTIDLSLGDSPSVTLTGNPTLAFSNPKAGQWHRLNLVQDGTGSRTVTWPSTGLVCTWRNTTGHTAPTLLTAAGAVDTIVIHTLSTTSAECWTTGNL